MACLLIAPIPVPGVTKENILHHLRQWRLTNLQQMVHMVSHQYVGIQPIPKSLLAFFKQVDIALTTPIIIKNQLFLIPSTHDVIEVSLEMYSRLPGHAAKLWQVFNNVKKACMTPSTFIVGGGVA